MSGRVRDGGAKALLARQLTGVGSNVDFMNLQTGAIRSKKPRKEKTQEEEVMAEMKKLFKKTFDCIQ